MSISNDPIRPSYGNAAKEIAQGAKAVGSAAAEAAKAINMQEDSAQEAQHAHEGINSKNEVNQVSKGKASSHIDFGELLKQPHLAKDALKLADEMNKTSKDPGKLAEQVLKFDKMVDKMDQNELMDVAHGLTDRLKNGQGDPQLTGTLLQRVLAEVDERGSHSIIEKLKPFPMPEPMPMPWPKPVHPFPGKPGLPIERLFDDVKPLHGKPHDPMMDFQVKFDQAMSQKIED